jgi:polar amino acid transport system substrate-binding protein
MNQPAMKPAHTPEIVESSPEMTQQMHSIRSVGLFRGVAAVALSVSVACTAAACGASGGSDGTDGKSDSAPALLQKMRKDGAKLTLAPAPPYEFEDANGNPKGYVVDVVNGVMKQLGIPRISVTFTSDGEIPALQSGRSDFSAGGLVVTKERCQALAFTSPWQISRITYLVKAGNPKNVTTAKDFAQGKSLKVAALTGSYEANLLRDAGVGPSQLIEIPDLQTGAEAVANGRADAELVMEGSLTDEAYKKLGLQEVIDPNYTGVGISIAFRKSDIATRDLYNEALNKMRSDGSLEKLYKDIGLKNWEGMAKITSATQLEPSCS